MYLTITIGLLSLMNVVEEPKNKAFLIFLRHSLLTPHRGFVLVTHLPGPLARPGHWPSLLQLCQCKCHHCEIIIIWRN